MMTAIESAIKAPIIGEIPNIIATAIPGRATWDRASPTSDMRFKTIKEPTYAEAAAIREEIIIKRKILSMTIFLEFMIVMIIIRFTTE